MSSLISLCSQKCSSGRSNRVVQWLDKECIQDSPADQALEFRLALDIAKAGGIGCASGDEIDALNTPFRLSKHCKQYSDQGKMKEIMARALGCTACLMLWGREVAFCDSPKNTDKRFLVSWAHCNTIEEKMGLVAGQSVGLLTQAAIMGDSFAEFYLGVFFFCNHDNEEGKKKAIELIKRASDNGCISAMVNLAVCYEKGDGVPQDKKKAIELLQKAADMGNTNAMKKLRN